MISSLTQRLKLPLLNNFFLNEILDIVADSVVGHSRLCHMMNHTDRWLGPGFSLLFVVLSVVTSMQPHMAVQGGNILEPAEADGALNHVWALFLSIIPSRHCTASFEPSISIGIVMLLITNIFL